MSASEVEILSDEGDELEASCLWSEECGGNQLQKNPSNEERYHLTGPLSQTQKYCFHAVKTGSMQHNRTIHSACSLLLVSGF